MKTEKWKTAFLGIMMKDTTKSESSVLYLNILLEKDINSNLTTNLYDKLDYIYVFYRQLSLLI